MAHRRLHMSKLNIGLFVSFLSTALVTFFLARGCSPQTDSAVAAIQPTQVSLFSVQNRQYQENSELMALVNSKHATDIQPQVSGRVVRVLVTDGQTVRAGQPLYQLDASQQAADVQGLTAIRRASMEEPGLLQKNIEALQADLSSAKADLAFSIKQRDRYQQLLEEKAVSASDTEQYQTEVLTREQKIKNIQANIAVQTSRRKEALAHIGRDTAALQSASTHLSYFTVRAPFTGSVGTILAKVGDVVDPQTVLTTLTDNRNLEIDVAVSADERARIRMGMPMQLLTMQDAPLGEVEVTYIAPKVDPLSQTFLLKAKILNTKNALAMDQHLKVRLIWGESQAILIPVVSVFHLVGMPFVYRTESDPKNRGQVARMQALTLGPIVDQNVVVLTGLKPGDTIVQSGIQKLQDGSPVTPTRPETGRDAQQSIKQE